MALSLCTRNKPKITFACNGKSVLGQCVSYKGAININWKHVDIISGIIGILQHSQISLTLVHIKGHQDNIEDEENLDIYAQLNIQMDTLAKRITRQYAQTHRMPPQPTQMFKGMQIMISIQNIPVSSQIAKTTRNLISHSQFRGKESSTHCKHFISKTICNKLRGGEEMRRRGKRLNQQCP